MENKLVDNTNQFKWGAQINMAHLHVLVRKSPKKELETDRLSHLETLLVFLSALGETLCFLVLRRSLGDANDPTGQTPTSVARL